VTRLSPIEDGPHVRRQDLWCEWTLEGWCARRVATWVSRAQSEVCKGAAVLAWALLSAEIGVNALRESLSAMSAQQGTACRTAVTGDHAGSHAATRHGAGRAVITCRIPVSHG